VCGRKFNLVGVNRIYKIKTLVLGGFLRFMVLYTAITFINNEGIIGLVDSIAYIFLSVIFHLRTK
jgi:hypothetical protein